MAEEKMFKAKAKIQIKYNSEYIMPGKEFKVKASDVEEISKYAEVSKAAMKANADNKEGE